MDGASAPATLCLLHLGQREGKEHDHPRILLLHGNPATKEDWTPFAERLEDDAEIVALDLPGFGGSDRLIGTSDSSLLELHADCARAVIDHVGWRDCVVVGHSHGAAIAHTLAVRHPDVVQGLALISGPGVRTHRSYRLLCLPGVPLSLAVLALAFRVEALRGVLRAVISSIMKPMFHPGQVPAGRAERQHALLEARPSALVDMAVLARDRPCEQLARSAGSLRIPTLFVHGDDDQLVPISYARGLHEASSGAHSSVFHAIGGAGHMVHETHPQEVLHLLRHFLRQLR